VAGPDPAAGQTPTEASPASRVGELLDEAEAAERQGHLIYPASGSAMSLYHEILFVDPENAFALEGLTRLAEHYLEQAQEALNAKALIKADSLVSKARMIYPEYPGVAMLDRQIELLERAETTRRTLDWRLVADRDTALERELTRLGATAKRDHCRVTIQVSHDAEGRWVYRALNRAPGPRLSAELKIASPAAVEMVCFDDAQVEARVAQDPDASRADGADGADGKEG
jgi:hypothetical protein